MIAASIAALRRRIGIVGIVGGDHGCPPQPLRQPLFGQVLGTMAIDDVADLVPQHAGQLARGLQPVEQRVGDENLAAGQSEGVDRMIVAQHVEFEIGLIGRILDVAVCG